MAILSMTGFARKEGLFTVKSDTDSQQENALEQTQDFSWVWELKTVNGRGLDLRFRLPNGYDSLESQARKLFTKSLKRGSVSLSLQLSSSGLPVSLKINQEFLEEVITLSKILAERITFDPPSLDGLLALKGVLEPVTAISKEEEVSQRKILENILLQDLKAVLEALVQSRQEEGSKLETIVRGQLTHIRDLITQAKTIAEAQSEVIKKRFVDNLKAVLESIPQLSEERLAQEVAILCVKADICEELDRLSAHIEQAWHLLDQAASGKEESIGRKLDFLCQEFNREANTLCSKSADLGLTALGLELKSVIDQMREQVQNIE